MTFEKISISCRGDISTKFDPKVIPIAVFTKRNDVALVPGHLNYWFWLDFDKIWGIFLFWSITLTKMAK